MEEVLYDKYNRRVGIIKQENGNLAIYDAYNRRLGFYDGKYTYDHYNRRLGTGNLLVWFVKDSLKI
jgi:hypothetical protein